MCALKKCCTFAFHIFLQDSKAGEHPLVPLEVSLSKHVVNAFHNIRESEKYLETKNSSRYPWPLRDDFKVSPSKNKKR